MEKLVKNFWIKTLGETGGHKDYQALSTDGNYI